MGLKTLELPPSNYMLSKKKAAASQRRTLSPTKRFLVIWPLQTSCRRDWNSDNRGSMRSRMISWPGILRNAQPSWQGPEDEPGGHWIYLLLFPMWKLNQFPFSAFHYYLSLWLIQWVCVAEPHLLSLPEPDFDSSGSSFRKSKEQNLFHCFF